jgi:uncharacterized protein
MRPPSRPGDLAPLDHDECLQLLRAAPWARIAFVADDGPTVLPVNVLLHDDALYVRTAPGSKLGNAAASGPVAIQADGGDEATRAAWSVLARGRAGIVTDPALEETLFAQPFVPWVAPDVDPFWIEVTVTSLTGRRLVRG